MIGLFRNTNSTKPFITFKIDYRDGELDVYLLCIYILIR